MDILYNIAQTAGIIFIICFLIEVCVVRTDPSPSMLAFVGGLSVIVGLLTAFILAIDYIWL